MLKTNSTWFGSATGFIKRLSPEARLFSSSLVLLSVIISLPTPGAGILFSLCVCCTFLLICGLPLPLLSRVVLPLTLLISVSFLIITLPAFLSPSPLFPFSKGITPETQLALGSIFAKLLATSLISTAMLASVRYEELYRALNKLPLPATPLLILLQIVHQTSILFSETIRLHHAITLRGNIRTLKGRKYIGSNLPQTWLLRMFARTDRVARGLEMRLYGTITPPKQVHQFHMFDWGSGLIALSLFAFVLINLLLNHG